MKQYSKNILVALVCFLIVIVLNFLLPRLLPGNPIAYLTGFSEEDLQLLWQAILNMFELDHSAARGKMAVRELIVFRHDSELGNAPAYKLFDLVKAERKPGVVAPRAYCDYTVSVNEEGLPEGVTCTRMG